MPNPPTLSVFGPVPLGMVLSPGPLADTSTPWGSEVLKETVVLTVGLPLDGPVPRHRWGTDRHSEGCGSRGGVSGLDVVGAGPGVGTVGGSVCDPQVGVGPPEITGEWSVGGSRGDKEAPRSVRPRPRRSRSQLYWCP